MTRAANATLSTENLLHNIAVIKKAAPNKKIMAMVKANAYGHGLRSVAFRLENHVDHLGVASIDEALALRKIGVNTPITLMEGAFEPEELVMASTHCFSVVFHDESQVNWLETSFLPLPLNAWMKIDTGMGRLGFSLTQAKTMYHRLSQNQCLIQPIGIMSHLACADNKDYPLNQKQISAFNTFAAQMQGLKSLVNSAGIFNFPSAHYDVMRPGIAIYGISPIKGKSAAELNLRPVMTLQSRLIAVRTFNKNQSVGYGAQFTCPENMPVGVVALGYGDGYPRTARTGTPVLVNNIRCQLIGRVSMDMFTVDLRPCQRAKVGDPVILWGDQLPMEEVTAYTAHSPYDLVTGVQQRVRFRWTPLGARSEY
jgi:alanine racemase